jgi:4-methyl-5(b-hydroxyethyl)-thiazole monophosphate biosynthesis
MAKTVCIHLAEGFEEIEAITIIDVLRRANIHTTTVTVTGTSRYRIAQYNGSGVNF